MSISPYLRDEDFTLYNGDAREVLAGLPDESVHMCVTSPPFFGLRDYGTGTWEGGDGECDHIERVGGKQGGAGNTLGKDASHPNRESLPETGHALIETQFKIVCGKCGATRTDRQIGLEETPEEWVASLVLVFEEVRRVLRKDGTLWVECGDSYGANQGAGFNVNGRGKPESLAARASFGRTAYKPKDLIGQPFLLAFALRQAGWYWRNVCIWHKPNPMPESVRDRFTVSHSYVLLFSKSPRYFFDAEAVREDGPSYTRKAGGYHGRDGNNASRFGGKGGFGDSDVTTHGRNARSVWTIPTEPLPFEHYAAFPQALAERCIKAGTSERGCCPECGAPWVREVEKGEPILNAWSAIGAAQYDDAIGGMASRSLEEGSTLKHVVPRVTLGWRPSCDCFATDDHFRAHHWDPVPCTVLDPFLGSATTALVARRLNRRCIGIELSERYCELAAKRTQQLSLEALPPAAEGTAR